MVHVAVAVIIRDGQILISKRSENVHQGGLWEFPGGKVEAGETITEALYREIKEELGINIRASRPLIKLVHHYADKSVVLETRIVTSFDGNNYQLDSTSGDREQLGLEGQQVMWIRPEELNHYQFPAANQAIISALMLPETYLITPDDESILDNTELFIEEFSHSIQNHCLIQLRFKHIFKNKELKNNTLKNNELKQLILQLCDIAKNNGIKLLVNSSMLSGDDQSMITRLTDGIHLTSTHLHERSKESFIKHYRKQFPEKKIAASCHCENDIERANDLKLDFIVISAVQATASHPDQTPLGWKQFKRLCDIAKMPVFALGGMTPDDISLAQENGAQGISGIRSLWNKDFVRTLFRNV